MTRMLSRRRLLNAATGLSVLALTQGMLGGTALAAPTAGRKNANQKARREALKAAKARRPPSRAVGPEDLTPEDRELVRALVAKTRHAIASAAAHPETSFATGGAAAAAAKFLTGQRRARKSRAKARAQKLLAGSSAEREAIFGALADADANEHKSKKKHKQIDDAAKKVHRKKKGKKKNDDEHDGPRYERLEFHLNWVDCNEETDELSASDEILLGGHLVTPTGHIETISRFKVSDEFDAGETVLYDYGACAPFGNHVPPTFDMLCPNGGPSDPYHGRVLAGARVKPGTYALVLLMGEEDTAGGFAEIVADVYRALEKEIDDALRAGASALAGPFGPAIAAAIGEVLEWLVALVDNPDDLLATRTWTLQIVNDSLYKHRTELKPALAAPKGTWACPIRTMQFNGESARYEVGLHWRAMT